jgi:hypothetical protein
VLPVDPLQCHTLSLLCALDPFVLAVLAINKVLARGPKSCFHPSRARLL